MIKIPVASLRSGIENADGILEEPEDPYRMPVCIHYEKPAQFNNKFKRESVIHEDGTGISGTFDFTGDITGDSGAEFFFKAYNDYRTFLRLDFDGWENGSTDPEVRNWNPAGNNTPFPFPDELKKIPDLIVHQKYNPKTRLKHPGYMRDLIKANNEPALNGANKQEFSFKP